MDTKTILIFFIIYVSLKISDELIKINNWILAQLLQLIICFIVFFVFSLIWNKVLKKPFSQD
jgi:hypothetical protein